MNQKIVRYTLGFLFLAVILCSISMSPKMLFAVSVIFIIFAIKEYREMFLAKNIYIHKYIPELISILCAYIFIKNIPEFITPCLLAGIFLSFAITVIKNKKPYTITTFGTVMGFVFPFCAMYIIKLFYFFDYNQVPFILIYFLSILLGDFSASQIGPHFKNQSLSSEISPNKTVAGTISNLVFTFLSSLLLIPILDFNVVDVLIFSLSVSISSQIGDLSISTIKRDLGLKHSGSFFLDYGGILDRADAFIFSAPAAYYSVILISFFK